MAKVLLVCSDLLHATMAGPAIRYWEFAHALAKEHSVTLFSLKPTSLKSERFAIKSSEKHSLKEAVINHDVIVTQVISWQLAYFAKKYQKGIILDSYDPVPIESLELFKHRPAKLQTTLVKEHLAATQFSFLMADRIICASESQKNFWIGFMCSLGLVGPEMYVKDPSFKHKIGIAPFGLKSQVPAQSGLGLRAAFQLKTTDFVILWAGGMWNWFDPLTPIRAVHALSQKRSDIKLVFMGTKHPNPDVPEMKMTREALALSQELDLFNKHVFFNFGWVPYAERHNYLLDADLGISCHFDNLETRFSFRTRILDYLWTGLPILSTQGDYFADYIQDHHLGKTVPAQDPAALAAAIEELFDNVPKRKIFQANISRIRNEFSWDAVSQVLNEYVNELAHEKKNKPKAYWIIVRYLFQKVRLKGILPILFLAINRISHKINKKRIVATQC